MQTLLFLCRLATNPDSSSADGVMMISAIWPRRRFLGSPSSPQTPATTNYFLLVTETQSSEGRGIFCYCSYQANLRLSPPVGHSLSWSLFLSPLIGDMGVYRRPWFDFGLAKQPHDEPSGSIFWPCGSCMCGWVSSFITEFDLHISGA